MMANSGRKPGSVSRECFRATKAKTALLIVLLISVASPSVAYGQSYKEKVLYSFTGGPDGAYPYGSVIQDANGNLYGTTQQGGIDPFGYCASNGANGCGVVFKIDTSGTETVLYSFTGAEDGSGPTAGLIEDASGNLYGTTVYSQPGYGTVFKLDAAGTETTLYGFCVTGPPCADGANPYDGLIQDSDGNLYGTALNGGSGGGVLFKVSASGTETVLWAFQGPPDGAYPYSGVIQDAIGDFYGTTLDGGKSCECNCCGTVFKLDTSGQESILHNFEGFRDGSGPYGGLVIDYTGTTLYGTTETGGLRRRPEDGEVFQVGTNGGKKILYSFTGASGRAPSAALIFDDAGNLYGTTFRGGSQANAGVVFKVNKNGKEKVLYKFGGTSGIGPMASVILDQADSLYGTTVYGGILSCDGGQGCGVVFELTPQ
jgi:uncharacterized repeat protein (TIGR03803 family)